MNAAMSSGARRKVTLERTFKASIEEVWDLWATQEGIESWWGPDGFAVTVHKLDLRPGGELVYAMTAVASDQIEFMKKAGMPLTTESRVTYTDVIPPRRLAYAFYEDSLKYDAFGTLFTQPTLIFQGSRDALVNATDVQQFAATRPNVTLTLLDDDHQLIASLPRIWSEVQPFLGFR